MLKKTQKQIVIDQLNEYGEVTRNFALQNYISRLGAIICQLNDDGWELEGKYRGGDYVYMVQLSHEKAPHQVKEDRHTVLESDKGTGQMALSEMW